MDSELTGSLGSKRKKKGRISQGCHGKQPKPTEGSTGPLPGVEQPYKVLIAREAYKMKHYHERSLPTCPLCLASVFPLFEISNMHLMLTATKALQNY